MKELDKGESCKVPGSPPSMTAQWLTSYLRGLLKMLEAVNTGRHVHQVGNLRQSITHCLSLLESGKDLSGWCTSHLPDLVKKTKALYREHIKLKKGS